MRAIVSLLFEMPWYNLLFDCAKCFCFSPLAGYIDGNFLFNYVGHVYKATPLNEKSKYYFLLDRNLGYILLIEAVKYENDINLEKKMKSSLVRKQYF